MDWSNYRYDTPFPFESEMLYESYPAIRLSSSRTRTKSESTTMVTPSSPHPQGVIQPGHQSPSPDPSGPKDIGDGGFRQRTGSKGIRDFFRLGSRPTSSEDSDRKSKKATDTPPPPPHSPAECQGSRLSQLKESFRTRSHSDASSILRRHQHASAGDAERGHAGIEPQTPNATRHSIESEVKSSRLKWDRAQTPIFGRSHKGKCEDDVSTTSRSEKRREQGGTKVSKNDDRLTVLDSTLNTLRIAGYPQVMNGDSTGHLSPHSPCSRPKFLRGRIGPEEFIEMYRNRAFSDPRPQSRLEAIANVRMRRLKTSRLPTSPVYSGLDSLNEKKLILWRDKKEGTQLLVLPTDGVEDSEGIESISLNESPELIYWNVLKATKCYDIIPNSTKMVILDSQLIVKKALYALLNNGIRAAPIWDSETQQLSGMLTVTDFIEVLQRYYHCQPNSIECLEDHSISTFKGMVGTVYNHFVSIRPEDSLLDAIFALRHNAIHRLPVIDPSTGNILYMLTYKRLLNFLKTVIGGNGPTFMNKTIEELKIGTLDNIATVQLDTTIIAALGLLRERRVSSLPVIDSDRKLVSIYSRADVINMAAEKTYSQLDMTIGQARNGQEPMLTADNIAICQKTDSLISVVMKLARWEIHRLPVLDVSGQVIGIISVSDILRYIADQETSLAKSTN